MAYRPDDDEDELRFRQEKVGELIRMLPVLLGAALAGLLLIKSVTMIPAGHVGVKDLFGKVREDTLHSGIHLINPLLTVHRLTVRTQEIKEAAKVPSREGLTVDLEVSALFRLHPDKAAEVYRTVGTNYIEVIVEPTIRSVVRGVTASYDAKALYTAEREHIATEMYKTLEPQLTKRGMQLEQVLLRSVQLPPVLSAAIEKKLEAEQSSEQMKFVLEKESREAERKRIEAKGISDFQKVVSLGISDQLLRWKGIEATERLAASPNSKIVVVGSGKDGLPLILGK